jgi:ethanolamine ammonia-lyase large subunit
MLNYQSLAYHDLLYLRSIFNARPAPEFQAWLEKMDMVDRLGRMRLPSTSNNTLQKLIEAGTQKNAA